MDTITALALAFTWISMIAAGLYFQNMVKTILDINDSTSEIVFGIHVFRVGTYFSIY